MAKTANEELQDALIRHQIFLLRFSRNVTSRVNTLLNNSEAELVATIKAKLAANKGLSTAVELQRLRTVTKALTDLRVTAWGAASKVLIDEVTNLVLQEPATTASIVTTVLPVQATLALPTSSLLRSIATSLPFEGRILKDWAKDLERADLRRIHGAVQTGMVAGESSQAIARRVIGTARRNGIDGVTQMTRRQVEAVTRTAVQHVSSNGRKLFYKENADIIAAEIYTATLDSRTTPICRGLDGKKFELGKGPHPPLHFSCRSLRLPVMDKTTVGNRPAKPFTRKQLLREYAAKNNLKKVTSRNDLPYGTKGAFDKFERTRVRQLTGTVPASTTYQQWLSGQPASVQTDILGVTKAKLFRKGNLTLDKFTNRAGDELTLPEMAKKHTEAFTAAGLDPADFT